MKVKARRQGPDWRLFIDREVKQPNGKKKKKEIFVGVLNSTVAAALVRSGELKLEIEPDEVVEGCLWATNFYLDCMERGFPYPGTGITKESVEQIEDE